MSVEVKPIRGNRSFAIEKRTGLKTLSVTLLVAHDLGSFELPLEVTTWSSDPQILEETVRPALKGFAQELAEAHIQLPSAGQSLRAPTENTIPSIYVGLFWLDSIANAVHKAAGLEKGQIIDAACEYLNRLKLEDKGYSAFVEQGFREWNGIDTVNTEAGPGRFVLFAATLDGGAMSFT